MVLSWVVTFEAIKRVVCRLNRASARLLFDRVYFPGGLFQTGQRFRGQWLPIGRSDHNLRKPTKLFSIARDFRNHPVFNCRITSIIDRK